MGKMDKAIERIVVNSAITQKIVKALVDDISDRRGLKNEWDAIADDVKADIVEAWSNIILTALRVDRT